METIESKKYPRTPYLPFSPNIEKENGICDLSNFINKDIVITEKLDGGNTCLQDGKVYARSHSSPTSCPSFDLIKREYSKISWTLENTKVAIYGENCYAIHSIKYKELPDVFFVFTILNTKVDKFYSWNKITEQCNILGLSMVPVLFKGTFNNTSELKRYILNEMNKESVFGGDREGVVIRNSDSFLFDNLRNNVAKCVRKDHVQTNDHWSKNWKKQNILGDFK